MESDSERRGKITNLGELKNALDVENVLKKIGYDKSKPITSGDEVRDFCPIHRGDNQKSFCVNISEKIACCHSCGFKGDIFDVYKEARRLNSVREAAQELAEDIGFTLKYEGAIKTDMPELNNDNVIRTPQQVIDESKPLIEWTIYLKNKCVDRCNGLYIGKNDGGYESIVVPLRDVNGILQSVQFIQDNGRKFYLKNSETSAAFFVIDEAKIKDGDSVYLAEGLATALTIWMAYDKKFPVVSFGSCGNLEHTVNALIAKYSNIKLRICLDYNRAAFNQACKLQNLPNCSYCWPSFEGLNCQKNNFAEKDLADFNDIVSKCRQDIHAVKLQLEITHDYAEMAKECATLNSTKQDKTQAATKVSETLFDTKITNSGYDTFENIVEAECIKCLIRPFNDIVADGIDLLTEAEYFTGLNRVVVEAIFNTYADDKPVTIQEISLHAPEDKRLAVYERLEQISTVPTITPDQFKERIDILSKSSAKRQLENAVEKALSNGDPLHVTIQNLRQDLDHIQGKTVNILNQKQKLEKIIETLNDPKSTPIATGFKSLDKLLGGGIRKGELIVLTAGAGGGKSAFALNLADNLAQSGNAYCIYISVEVSEELLTDRSLKRLAYDPCDNVILSAQRWRLKGAKSYESFCENICIERGRDGMTVSEIRAKVLSAMQRTNKGIFLIIDPFQRLDTGNEKIDVNNETIKTGKVISDIKKMSIELNIPILAISDTTKGHKENTSGDGAGRNSYMIDHVADVVLMLRTSRDATVALIGNSKDKGEQEALIAKVLESKVQKAGSDKEMAFVKEHKLLGSSDVYAALVCPKARNSARINPLFIYHKDYHLFEDIELYEGLSL